MHIPLFFRTRKSRLLVRSWTFYINCKSFNFILLLHSCLRRNMTRLCVSRKRVGLSLILSFFLAALESFYVLLPALLDQFCDYLILERSRAFQCSCCSSPSIKWNKRRRGLSVAEWIMILPGRLVFRMIIVFSGIPMLKLSSWCSQKNK